MNGGLDKTSVKRSRRDATALVEPMPATPDELLDAWRDAVRAAELAERMTSEALGAWDDGNPDGIHDELNRLAALVAKAAARTSEHAVDATMQTERWHHLEASEP
jgi:hypothetical protein